jgi:23S rRNA pseudouridine1911/1915/1917 synthase
MNKSNIIVKALKTRLDKYLAENLTDISRSQIQRDIEAGAVLVNGEKILESKFVVRLNDKIEYNQNDNNNDNHDHDHDLKPTNTPLKILYNNHGLLIIDKPEGMVVHPGAGFKGETLASALLYHFSAKGGSTSGGKDIQLVGEDHRPGIVHRLDKDTSGIILVARTQEMYEHLKDAFAERKVKKEYVALVYGKVEKQHGFIETPMGKSKTDFRKQTTKDPVESKQAITEYKVLEYLMGEKGLNGGKGVSGVDVYTLVMVKLHTGRTHQIRVHFSSIGHPLMGDELYGPAKRGNHHAKRDGGKRMQLKGLKRQFLHAKKIEVQLPDKTWIEAESELANDLKEVLINLDSKTVNKL